MPLVAIKKNKNIEQLIQLVSHFAETEGDYVSSISGLSFHSRMSPTESTHCIYNLGVGLILQGQKEIVVGEKVYQCFEGQSMLTTIDLPATSHVVQASVNKPFLAVLLLLDLQMVNEVVANMPIEEEPSSSEEIHDSFSVDSLDDALTDAVLRLIKVLEEPTMIPHLVPLIQKEIIVRILNSSQGVYLRQLVKTGSVNQKIHQVVNWLKNNYTQPIRMDDLAERAFMSPSTFRQHFREITGMSPLQYQKQLRLQEARHLMLNKNLDAGRAASLVGYESASQFSREYSRLFGESPQRDVQRLKQSS
ncbi:AraC family transcriptional regulator [Acinetobacter baumannii]|uniref:AraC family transcriptional regulator n=1 Tax=Acinetobacter calcoaceticus/baumannii complex TaxID=909768 RepID=UPI0024487CC1|nr:MULTISPECIES: AraC family transcriptional regulator [Acinetobacter calcoaceticus/baumannii complex]MDH2549369.1 AraC family transcriptional regulator [Acinetobacter baumannii]MDO7244089.1 AraC family transcriptional regulator [Acinetobacter pittii]MDO7475214.1 AraC family transcriptional regulator [Acinetobacter baumannii]MDO7508895.1 AraC family transcriptional regulator [Acinetobacter baumannii]MDO7519884.1 AraC family transcriptional regulator [Acinetobacter baumannii]